MKILFTGHRDKVLYDEDLNEIRIRYRGNIWIHGGAIGFDTQIEEYAKINGIRTIVIYPDYTRYASKQAPIIRDKEMVEMAVKVVACYDGRTYGGTYFTIKYALQKGKEVIIYKPKGEIVS